MMVVRQGFPSSFGELSLLTQKGLVYSMIPIGYMYKVLWPKRNPRLAKQIDNVYTLGDCPGNSTHDFYDYVTLWKHNGYWLFNTPEEMQEIAVEKEIDLSKMTLFYYEAYEHEFDFVGESDEPVWSSFEVDSHFQTNIAIPVTKTFMGFDVVEYTQRNSPECSLLACTDLTQTLNVNEHCLFKTIEEAKAALENCDFHALEPGPYRVIAVYLVEPAQLEARGALWLA
jgi:hypothetical protein